MLCALSLHAVVLQAVGVQDCHEELTGREVLINAAVPCILKAQFQLCGDGSDILLIYLQFLYIPLYKLWAKRPTGETTYGRNDSPNKGESTNP